MYCSTFEIYEKHAALLLPTGIARGYYAPCSTRRSESAIEVSKARNVRNLRTDYIITCAGVVLRHDRTFALVHAFNLQNLDELLKKVMAAWRKHAPAPSGVALYTTAQADLPYEEVIKDHLPKVHLLRRTECRPAITLLAGNDIPQRYGEVFGWGNAPRTSPFAVRDHFF